MHELGLMTGVFEAVRPVALEAGATRVLAVRLTVGEMSDALADALEFAFEVLSDDDPLFKGARLDVQLVPCKSVCSDCGHEFAHERFEVQCPACGSFATRLVAGREFLIDNVEIETPD